MAKGLVGYALPVVGHTEQGGHARLAVLRLPITSSTAGTRFGKAGLISTAQSRQFSPPSAPLTLTRLVNLSHQAVHSPTHHCIHPYRSIGAAQWARNHGETSVLVCLCNAATP